MEIITLGQIISQAYMGHKFVIDGKKKSYRQMRDWTASEKQYEIISVKDVKPCVKLMTVKSI